MQPAQRDALRNIWRAVDMARRFGARSTPFRFPAGTGERRLEHPGWDRSWAPVSEQTLAALVEQGMLEATPARDGALSLVLTVQGQLEGEVLDEAPNIALNWGPGPTAPQVLSWLVDLEETSPDGLGSPADLLDRAETAGLIRGDGRDALARRILDLVADEHLHGTVPTIGEAGAEQLLRRATGLAVSIKGYTAATPPGPQRGLAAPSPPPQRRSSAPTAVIVWAHSDARWTPAATAAWEHVVRSFAHLLCAYGVDTDLDLFHRHGPTDWSRFGPRAINDADFVLVAASPSWRRAWEGSNDPTVNAGAAGEANVLRGLFAEDQQRFRERVVPVLLPGRSESDLPPDLGATLNWVRVDALTEDGIDDLLRRLGDQPLDRKPPVGPWRDRPARASPLRRQDIERDIERTSSALDDLPIALPGHAGEPWDDARGALQAREIELRRELELLERRGRSSTGRGPSRPREFAGRPLEFDGVDVGLQVLVGTLGRAFAREDIRASFTPVRWTAPAYLRDHAERYADERGFYDGEVAGLSKLDVLVYTDRSGAERHRLRLAITPTGYVDYLATNVALGPFTPDQAPLLLGREGIANTPMSNMVGLDLTLVTHDGHVPVFFRSAGMAGLESCWQSSSGETVQLPVDLDTNGHPDVFNTAIRGLREELGLTPEMISDLAVTALVTTPEFANIGVMMRGVIDCSGEDLQRRLNRFVLTARDNWEYTRHDILAIDNVSEVAAALTDPGREWTKQAIASLVFAHAERANGHVVPLAEAIVAGGGLNIQSGPATRDVLPPHWRPPPAED